MNVHKTLKIAFSSYLVLFLALGNLLGCADFGSNTPDPLATTADTGSSSARDIPIGLTDPVRASFALDDLGTVDILGVSAEKETRELILTCRFQGDETTDVRTIRLGKAESDRGWMGYMYAISIPGTDSWVTLTLELNPDGTMSRTRFRGPDEELISTYELSRDGSISMAEYMMSGSSYGKTVTVKDPSQYLSSSNQEIDELEEQYETSSLPNYESSAQMLSSLVYNADFQAWLLGAAGRLLLSSPDNIESAVDQLTGYGDDPGVRDMCGWANIGSLCCYALAFLPCWIPCVPGVFISAACGFIFIFDQVSDWWDDIVGGL